MSDKKVGVKLKTIMAGPDGAHAVGDVLLLDEDQARALIDGGFATAETAPAVAEIMKKLAAGEHETAALEAPETTAPPEGRKRRAGSKKREG